MTDRVWDLAVVGLGPAGRALAHRAATAGLGVVAVDPAPGRPWTPTYGAWADELPTWLGADVVAARVPAPTVWTRRATTLARPYVVLDNAALRTRLDLDAVRAVTGRAHRVTGRTVTLDDEFLAVTDGRGGRAAVAASCRY